MKKQLNIFAALLMLVALATCEKPPAPAPVKSEAPTAYVISGLGVPQTDTIVEMLTTELPEITTVNFGTGRDAYLADVAGYANATPHGAVILIGHSYGGDKSCQTAAILPATRLMILVDPIAEGIGRKLVVPSTVERCVVIWADFSGLIRPTVEGDYDECEIHTSHNKLPHNQACLNFIEAEVRKVIE